MSLIGHFIGGQHINVDERTQSVYNPATGEVTKAVSLASVATVEMAIAAAESAFPAWRETPPLKRAQVMFRYKQLLEQHADEICQLITEEHGKVLDDAMGELV
ncbi:MAG: aldehyde dehydrogenase family protein, partial [Sedimenticola sp.]|nr:aldehyde dehydrogenase family protein [Sedimenticola sp.]